MLYLICILPILIYFLFIKGMDGFALASWQKIVECFVWGLFCCVFGFFIGRIVDVDNDWSFPILEEIIKVLPLAVAIFRKRSAFFAEVLIYGTAVGAGFSLLENILYVNLNLSFTFGDALLRGFGTSLLHMGCTSLCASCILLGSRYVINKSLAMKVLAVILALVPSCAIHFTYNLFLLPELLQMVLAMGLIIGLFVLIYAFDRKKIHDWLDSCISNDISLLRAIKEGRLSDTSAGEYLLKMKDTFKPEVFFDVCVYLGLYLELTIAAKSRMILKEAEMDEPLPEEEHAQNLAKIQELACLEKNIGKSGLLVLSPIIDKKTTDGWVIEELL